MKIMLRYEQQEVLTFNKKKRGINFRRLEPLFVLEQNK